MLVAFVLAACAERRMVQAGTAEARPPASQEVQPAAPAVSFDRWLADFKAEAAAQGIRQKTLDAAFQGVKPTPQVISRDRNQAEFTLTLDVYRSRVVTPENVAAGRRMMAKHGPLLAAVGAKYGVQPRFIVAIWGIETRYGGVKPKTPLIPSLVTLAFDGRRSAFFRNELMQAMRMLDAGYATLPDLMGSWAGAMGQPQFMPSSYMKYAQDWDGDGKRDIWNNPGDVFASIAFFLASYGWSAEETWGRQVSVPAAIVNNIASIKRTEKSGCKALDQLTIARPLQEWHGQGVRRAGGGALPPRDVNGALALPESAAGEAYMVYGNYESILRYNCAHFYALTVGALSDLIEGS